MKKIFFSLILFFLFFGFYSCNVPDLPDDICFITTEICSYAQAICDLYSSDRIEKISDDDFKQELKSASDNLQLLYASLTTLSKHYSPDKEEVTRFELTKIRNQLKVLFDSHSQIVE